MNEKWVRVGVGGGQGSALAPDPCSSAPSPGGWRPLPTPEPSQALRHFLSSRTRPALLASGRRQLIKGKGHFVQAWLSAWTGATMSTARRAEQGTACRRVPVNKRMGWRAGGADEHGSVPGPRALSEVRSGPPFHPQFYLPSIPLLQL